VGRRGLESSHQLGTLNIREPLDSRARRPTEGGARMPRERACPRWILIAALLCSARSVRAEDHEAHKGAPARHDRPPRKVIVGPTRTRWYGNYTGLSGRLEQMRGLIDQMAAESRARYGRSLDLALFTEYAVTAGKPGPAAEVAVPVDDTILEALGSKAR